MATIRAVLFDFGGTLYDYAALEPGERESLLELARWAGADKEPLAVFSAYRDAIRRVFHQYLPQPYYLHRDLFRDAAATMLENLGARVEPDQLDRHRAAQWERHARHFALREGVIETLAALRARDLHIGMVSNIDDDQLAHLIKLGNLEPYFDSILSSEQAQSCKPDPAIFAEALRRAGCQPEEALFVGDTIRQDIAGANAMGLPSVLIWHRTDREPPTEPVRPTHVIRRIPELLGLIE